MCGGGGQCANQTLQLATYMYMYVPRGKGQAYYGGGGGGGGQMSPWPPQNEIVIASYM